MRATPWTEIDGTLNDGTAGNGGIIMIKIVSPSLRIVGPKSGLLQPTQRKECQHHREPGLEVP